jgi:hypothetical protein
MSCLTFLDAARALGAISAAHDEQQQALEEFLIMQNMKFWLAMRTCREGSTPSSCAAPPALEAHASPLMRKSKLRDVSERLAILMFSVAGYFAINAAQCWLSEFWLLTNM